jgi:hypothetical protein
MPFEPHLPSSRLMAPGRRRGITDPLKPLREPRWLVIRD